MVCGVLCVVCVVCGVCGVCVVYVVCVWRRIASRDSVARFAGPPGLAVPGIAGPAQAEDNPGTVSPADGGSAAEAGTPSSAVVLHPGRVYRFCPGACGPVVRERGRPKVRVAGPGIVGDFGG